MYVSVLGDWGSFRLKTQNVLRRFLSLSLQRRVARTSQNQQTVLRYMEYIGVSGEGTCLSRASLGKIGRRGGGRVLFSGNGQPPAGSKGCG